MKRWSVFAVFATIVAVAAPVYALDPFSPAVEVHTAPQAYRNVVTAGDVLVVFRITMEETAWSAYNASDALTSLLDGATSVQDRVPPAKGETISAFYLSGASTVTWDSALTVRLAPSPSLFTTTTISTTPVEFNDSFVPADACNQLRATLALVESESVTDAIDVGDYVSGTTILEAGTAVAVTAFGQFGSVLPNCFFVGVESPDGVSNINDAGQGLGRSGRQATIEATAAWTRFETLAAEWGFDTTIKARTLAAMLGVSFAVVALIVSMVAFGSSQFGAEVAALALLVAAINASGLLMQIVFVLLTIGVFLSAAFWLRGFAR